MNVLLAAATIKGPHIDWAALSPLIALTAGACVVLLLGVTRSAFVRAHLVPALTIVALGVTAGLAIWQWDANTQIISRALDIDTLSMALTMVFVTGAIAAVLLSWRSSAVREAGEGEYFALLLS